MLDPKGGSPIKYISETTVIISSPALTMSSDSNLNIEALSSTQLLNQKFLVTLDCLPSPRCCIQLIIFKHSSPSMYLIHSVFPLVITFLLKHLSFPSLLTTMLYKRIATFLSLQWEQSSNSTHKIKSSQCSSVKRLPAFLRMKFKS